MFRSEKQKLADWEASAEQGPISRLVVMGLLIFRMFWLGIALVIMLAIFGAVLYAIFSQ